MILKTNLILMLKFNLVSLWNITSNEYYFGCPIIYSDVIQNAILFIDTLTILDTNKLLV